LADRERNAVSLNLKHQIVSFWSKYVRFYLFSGRGSFFGSVFPLRNSYLNTAKLPSLVMRMMSGGAKEEEEEDWEEEDEEEEEW